MADQPTILNRMYSEDAETRIWSRVTAPLDTANAVSDIGKNVSAVLSAASDMKLFSDELRGSWNNLPSEYQLNPARANALRPFETALRSDVLEIGAECGVVSRYLGECGATLVALESDLESAKAAALRLHDLPNAHVVCDTLHDFESDARFDVVTILDAGRCVEEWSEKGGLDAMLKKASYLLKPQGLLIVASENRFGLKYFASGAPPRQNTPLFSDGGVGAGDPRASSAFFKAEMCAAFKRAGFSAVAVAAAFPDHKLTRSIVTPAGLSHVDYFDSGVLAAQSATRDPSLPKDLLFALEPAWIAAGRGELLSEVANSFIYVAHQSEQANSFPEDILAYHYSTERLESYCKVACFRRLGDGNINVERRMLSEKLVTALDSEFSCEIEDEPLHVGRSFDTDFQAIVTTPGWDAAMLAAFFRRYISMLTTESTKRGRVVPTPVHASTHLPGSLLDFIPNNIAICDHGNADGPERYVPYDQEWRSQADLPLGYMVFRSLMNISGSVSRYQLPVRVELLNRRTLFAEVFRELGLEFTADSCDEYWRRESKFLIFATGEPISVEPVEWFDSYFSADSVSTENSDADLLERGEMLRQISEVTEKLAWTQRGKAEVMRELVDARRAGPQLAQVNLRLSAESAALGQARSELAEAENRISGLSDQLRRLQRETNIVNEQFSNQCEKIAALNDSLDTANATIALAGERAAIMAKGLQQLAAVNDALSAQNVAPLPRQSSFLQRASRPLRSMSRRIRTGLAKDPDR